MSRAATIAAAAFALLIVSDAPAATFVLDRVADGDSRFFDLRSGAFAQIDQSFSVPIPAADGYYSVEAETNSLLTVSPSFVVTQLNVGNEAAFDSFTPTNFSTLGAGADIFPSEGNFNDVGSVDYDANTGAVTGLTLDVFPFVRDDFSQLAFNTGPYATVIDPNTLSGTVSTTPSGGVTGVNLTADISFVYGGAISYDGTLEITGDSFDLFVDENELVPFGPQFVPFRFSWDIEGRVSGLVPEPASAVLLAAVAGVAGTRRRR